MLTLFWEPSERVNCSVCGKELFEENLILHARMRVTDPAHYELLKQILRDELREFARTYDVSAERYEIPPDHVIARGIINSLQHGTPPNMGIQHVTVGRNAELKRINELIEGINISNGMVVLGDYGWGKTHVLLCAREIAFAHHCLVFQVDIVGSGVSLQSPSEFCEALLKGMRFPDFLARKGRKEILLKLRLKEAEAFAREELGEEEIFGTDELAFCMGKVLERSDGHFDRELSDWLADSRTRDGLRLTLPDVDFSSFVENMTCLAKDVGFNGCVFLVDELEEDRNVGSYENIMAILNEPRPDTVWIFFGNRDLIYAPGSGIRDAFPELMPKVLQLAVELSSLEKKDYVALLQKILTEFDLAYGTDFVGKTSPKAIRTYVERHINPNTNPREFISHLVRGLLDIHRRGSDDFEDLL